MKRRSVLAGGTIPITVLSGCLGGFLSDDEDGDESESDDGDTDELPDTGDATTDLDGNDGADDRPVDIDDKQPDEIDGDRPDDVDGGSEPDNRAGERDDGDGASSDETEEPSGTETGKETTDGNRDGSSESDRATNDSDDEPVDTDDGDGTDEESGSADGGDDSDGTGDEPDNSNDESDSESDESNNTDGESGEPDDESDEPDRSHPSEPEGMVVFTYDDSPIEDYTMTYSVHQKYDVPGCVAACPDLIESSDDYMDVGHVKELHDAGWEIMSHTSKHRSVGYIYLDHDAKAGDDRIYVEVNHHGDYPGDPLVITDGKRTVEATVAGSGTDDTGQYIDLESGIDSDIDAGRNAYVRYPEDFLRTIFADSKRRLEEWGIDVTGFVYPYGRYDGLAERLVPEYYDAVPNSRWSTTGRNPIDGLEPTQLVRKYVETDHATRGEIDDFMASVASEDVLGIVGGHSHYDTLTARRVEYAIESALEHDLRIVTLREALSELGHL